MKRKVVELDATSRDKVRTAGDAPDLSRVAKVMPGGKNDESGGRLDIADKEDGVQGEWLIKLGMISALVIGLVVGGGLIYSTVVRELRPAGMSTSEKARPVDLARDAEPNHPQIKLSEAEALDLVRRGLAVRFAGKVTEHFLCSERYEAIAVVEFLKGLSERNGLVVGMDYLEPVSVKGVMMGRVRVHFRSGQRESSRDAYLLESPAGDWRIDFDSFISGDPPEPPEPPEPDTDAS